MLGITNGNDGNVGSGGWTNIVDKYAKAKNYCEAPFEVQRYRKRNVQVPVRGEWIGERRDGKRGRKVTIHCGDASAMDIPPKSLDAVLTDPPYFGNVQYGELMDFCYVWLRGLVGSDAEGFDQPSTRATAELTGNVSKGRGLEHFTEGLSRVYRSMSRALKPGAPLAFTFHHNKVEAYCAVGVAILDSGLTCSASLPCPAEMGGSIHIHGTTSSVVDTVFVCREQGRAPRQWLFETAEEFAAIVASDLAQLAEAGLEPSVGDTRCIIFGHLTRMAVWNSRQNWDRSAPTSDKIDRFAQAISSLPSPGQIQDLLRSSKMVSVPAGPLFATAESKEKVRDGVAF